MGIVSTITLIGMMSFYTQHEQQTIMAQHEKARHDMLRSVIGTLRAVMLTGTARIAQSFADRLKDLPGIIDFRIIRLDGLEAFRDNKTIDLVNWNRGREIFQHRELEEDVRVLPADNAHLALIATSDQIQSYTEQAGSEEGRMNFLAPITNERECHRCHDNEKTVLGAVLLVTSLTDVNKSIVEARTRATRIVIVSLFILLLMVYILIQRSVIGPLSEITQAMVRVAEGDLTLQVPLFRDIEFKHMASSFNRMISELLHTHKGFIQERNKLSTIILSAREGIVVTDQHGHVVLVNPAAERLLGKSTKQILKEGFYNLFDEPEHMKALVGNLGHETPNTIVFNGHILNINGAVIQNTEGETIGSAAMIRDITEEKKLEETLRHLSYTDKLTGLFNRRRMEELLAQEFDRASRYGYCLSLMLFDVDHFKKFNDTYGHDQGDRVLAAIGFQLKDYFRKTDFPCRYGGEEFCVILTSTPICKEQSGALVAADRFRQRIENMDVDGLKVTISIGLSVYPGTAATVEELLKEADNALYEAKHRGRNQVVMSKPA